MSDINPAQIAFLVAAGMVPPVTDADVASLGKNPPSPAEWWEALVADKAKELLAMSSGKTRLGSEVASVLPKEQRESDAPEVKVFKGVVQSFRTEPTSGRVVVQIFTGTKRTFEGVPVGSELVRTEHLSNPHGRMLARKARDLVGHEVLVFVEMQPMESVPGQSVRIAKFLRDLGPAKEANAA